MVVAVAIVGGGIVGGLVSGVLSAYWWNFPPEDDAYDVYIVRFYATLGAIIELFGAAILVGLAIVLLSLGTARPDRINKVLTGRGGIP